MAILQINFNNDIDNALCIGDLAFYCIVSGDGICLQEPQLIGPITDYGEDYIVVDDLVTGGLTVTIDMFILFSKPIQVEESGLKGYYANVTFENNSKTPIELYAISSEAVISSK